MSETVTGNRRNTFLVLMVAVGNLYLVGFALDGLISVVDELVRAATGSDALGGIRESVAVLVLLASALMLVVILFVPHLPKRVFLPLIAFALWAVLGAPPLFPGLDDRGLFLAISVLQVVLAVVAFLLARMRTGGYLISPSALPTIRHLVLRTAIASVVLIIGFPIMIAGLGALGTAAYLEQSTDGFVNFTTSEIELTERVYERDGKQVIMIGMMHFGEPDFYDSLFNGFPPDAVVLAEGVTDKQNVLSSNLSYQRLARVLGLEQQPVLLPSMDDDFARRLEQQMPDADGDELTLTDDQGNEVRTAKVRPDVLYADADLSDFSETTIAFLNEVAALYASESIEEAMERFAAFEEQFTDEDVETVYDDIIYFRNDRLIGALDKNLAVYDTIIIPWGAMHMPDLQTKLFERGFEQVSERAIPLVRYQTVLDQLQRMRQAA